MPGGNIKVKSAKVAAHVKKHGGSLFQLKNGQYNIRKGNKSVNIGKPNGNNQFVTQQLFRAWGDSATGIPNPNW